MWIGSFYRDRDDSGAKRGPHNTCHCYTYNGKEQIERGDIDQFITEVIKMHEEAFGKGRPRRKVGNGHNQWDAPAATGISWWAARGGPRASFQIWDAGRHRQPAAQGSYGANWGAVDATKNTEGDGKKAKGDDKELLRSGKSKGKDGKRGASTSCGGKLRRARRG